MAAVFLDFGTVSHDDLDTSSLERVLPGIKLYPASSDAEVDERIAGCEFILTNKLNITRARMRAVPGLKFIGLTATGTNNIDLEAAKELGIAVCNIRDYCTVSLVQHVIGVMLMLTHRFREYGQAAIDGTWATFRTVHRGRRAHPRAQWPRAGHRRLRQSRPRRGQGRA